MRGPAPTMQSCFVLVDCSSGMPSLLRNSVGGGSIELCRQPNVAKTCSLVQILCQGVYFERIMLAMVFELVTNFFRELLFLHRVYKLRTGLEENCVENLSSGCIPHSEWLPTYL